MRIETRFEGGLGVSADLRGHRVLTDQPVSAGGDGAAPSPFDLFLASLATCAGYYALQFCRKRGIDESGLAVAVDVDKDPETGRLSELSFEVSPPAALPEKYREALLRAVDQCAVKRALGAPPVMTSKLTAAESDRAA
jgi:ribosomal protein S12 methylthiotransferase accessory factor